ncbi:MAG: glutathione binding-like protein [Pseudomonadota bacterium]
MDLYFSPLACSLATRISLYEAGGEARYLPVDLKARRTADGDDFLAINPKGQVPVIRTDEGELLTENAAILTFVAERHPVVGAEGFAAFRLREWLSFISAELHRGVFGTLVSPLPSEGAKAQARADAAGRLAHLDAHLAGRDFLLDRFTVADAYLTTVLNWNIVCQIDMTPYPNVAAYHQRMLARPAVRRAVSEEQALYAAA